MRARSVRPAVERLENRLVPAITYHGGPVLAHPEIVPVYIGRDWSQSNNFAELASLNNYLAFLVSSPYMDMLGEYAVGRGVLAGTGYIDSAIGGGQTISDQTIQNLVEQDIAKGALPPPDPNRVYMVFTEPNVVVTAGGGNSQKDFYGYHDYFTGFAGLKVNYAVIGNPVGNGPIPGRTTFQTLTEVASHELAETATDPNVGGWYDGSSQDEIVDVVNSADGVFNGFNVQAVWSVQHNSAVLPGGSQPLSPGELVLGPTAQAITLGGIADNLTHSAEAYQGFIGATYQKYLGRAPDAAGLAYWTGQMQQGVSDEQLEANLIGSSEYIADHGGSISVWVTGMYHDLLGRSPADAEVTYWDDQVAAGVQPYQVALGFAASAERETLRVQSDYTMFLGRSPAPSETNYWVGQFVAGASNEDVVAGFVGGAEYFHNPQKGHGDNTTWLTSAYHDVLHRAPGSAELQYWLGLLG